MGELSARLQMLERVLVEVDAPIVRHLRPGANQVQVTAALAEVGIGAYTDVLTWWGWHDGTDLPRATSPAGHALPRPGNHLLGGLHLLALDEAVVAQREAAALEAEYGLPGLGRPVLYWPGWCPVAMFTDGWLVCVDTLGSCGPVGSLFVWDTGDASIEAPMPWFESLTALVNAVIDTYRTGRVSPNDLVIDPTVLPESAQPLNY